MTFGRTSRAAILLVVASIAAAILVTFPRWTVDDAYITFRYARNLAEHGRLVWNLIGDPVEGYTGVALPLLVAGAIRVGISPIVASQAIGVAALAGATLTLAGILKRARASAAVILGASAAFAVAPALYTHAFAGLETMLFSFTLLLALDRTMAALDPDASPRSWTWFGLSLLLLSATRPEGMLFSASLVLVAVAFTFRTQRFRRFALATGAAFVAPFALYFLWRWTYYGRLFPNTYYVKATAGFFPVHVSAVARWWTLYLAIPVLLLAHVLPRAADPGDRRSVLLAADLLGVVSAVYLIIMRLERTTSAALVIVALIAASISIAMRVRALPRTVTAPVVVVAVVSVAVVTKYLATDLVMNYSYRFFVPVFGIALAAAALSARAGVRAQKHPKPAAALVVTSIVTVAVLYAGQLSTERRLAERYERAQRDEHIAIGRDLRRILPQASTIGVHFDAGAIPYYAERRAVDFGRLNDEYLTDHVGDIGAAVEYFYRSDIGAFVVTSTDRTTMEPLAYAEEVRAILADARFSRYRLWRRYTTAQQPYSEFVYLRDDVTA